MNGHSLLVAVALVATACGASTTSASGPATAPPAPAPFSPLAAPSTAPAGPSAELSEGARLVLLADDAEVVRGAKWLSKNGTAADGPSLELAFAAVLARIEKGDADAEQAFSALRVAADDLCERGLRVEGDPKSRGALVLWTIANLRAHSRQPGWETRLASAIRHPDSNVARIALLYMPSSSPPAVAEAVKDALSRPEPEISRQACLTAGNAKFITLAPDVLARIDASPDPQMLQFCLSAATHLGKRYEGAEALVRRITDPAVTREAIVDLTMELIEHSFVGVGANITPADAKIHQRAWSDFLKKRRRDIEAGKKFVIDASVSRRLFPKDWGAVPGAGP